MEPNCVDDTKRDGVAGIQHRQHARAQADGNEEPVWASGHAHDLGLEFVGADELLAGHRPQAQEAWVGSKGLSSFCYAAHVFMLVAALFFSFPYSVVCFCWLLLPLAL